MTSIINETRSEAKLVAGTNFSCRWAAPELLDPESFGMLGAKPSKASDVYSFAMLAVEVPPKSTDSAKSDCCLDFHQPGPFPWIPS
jgi:hypothetical protein